eukprot:1159685-Pelagomonas_calceolata.AAC.2
MDQARTDRQNGPWDNGHKMGQGMHHVLPAEHTKAQESLLAGGVKRGHEPRQKKPSKEACFGQPHPFEGPVTLLLGANLFCRLRRRSTTT